MGTAVSAPAPASATFIWCRSFFRPAVSAFRLPAMRESPVLPQWQMRIHASLLPHRRTQQDAAI